MIRRNKALHLLLRCCKIATDHKCQWLFVTCGIYHKGERMDQRELLKDKKRIVIKIGSSSITHKSTGHISVSKLEKFVRQISDLKNAGKEVVLVTSGAQAVGVSSLNLSERPVEIEKRQAIAAVGQASLMTLYQKLFREYNQIPGQVLITKDVVEEPTRLNNAMNTFKALLDYNVIPVVNENDTVATDEIIFGDNDTLSAIVATMVKADLLILLSDIDGLYEADPNQNPDAKLIDIVEIVDESIERMATGSVSRVGTGGMTTKIQAAKIATNDNIDMVIANALEPLVIERIIDGEHIGTLFLGQHRKV